MAEEEVTVTLTNHKVQFTGISSANPDRPVNFDYKPPIKFERISLNSIVDSKDAKDPDIQKAIQLAEESVCPVWQMIKNNVEVRSGYDFIAS